MSKRLLSIHIVFHVTEKDLVDNGRRKDEDEDNQSYDATASSVPWKKKPLLEFIGR